MLSLKDMCSLSLSRSWRYSRGGASGLAGAVARTPTVPAPPVLVHVDVGQCARVYVEVVGEPGPRVSLLSISDGTLHMCVRAANTPFSRAVPLYLGARHTVNYTSVGERGCMPDLDVD